MRAEYWGVIATALLWGAYPLVSRSVEISGVFSALILSLAGLVPTVAVLAWQGVGRVPVGGEWIRLIVAGFMMSGGLMAFLFVSGSRRIDASISVPMLDTAMLIVTVVGAVVFFHEPVTARKLFGIALLLGGIAVLRPA